MKLSTLGLMASIVLVACGKGPTSLAPTSSPAALITCSLPVNTWTQNGGNLASQNGSISVPSGRFTPDPTSSGGSYDGAYRRWVPVLISQVLPDGSAYAYEKELPDGPYEIHVVQVATGADKMIYRMPYDNAYSILALQPEGVYLVPIFHKSGIPTGLWLLSSKAPTQTAVPGAADLRWQAIAGGAAWGGPAGGDSLARLDVSTGAVTTWFRHAVAEQTQMGYGYGPAVVGFDLSGRPLVEFYPPIDTTASPARAFPAPEVWLVSSPSQATKLTGMPLPVQFLQAGVTDSHGTWLVGTDGFYLYTDTGFKRAAPMPQRPDGNFAIAGPCA